MKYDLEYIAIDADDGMRLKSVLRKQKGISTRLIRRIVHGVGVHGELPPSDGRGNVYINGSPSYFSDIVHMGDHIGLIYPKESTHILPEEMPLEILYEDEDILAINKPPGIIVHPTKGHPDGTIANGVTAHMIAKGETYKPRFINRLDMDTSGVLLVGKNTYAQDFFTKESQQGRVEKNYIAAVHGFLTNELGVIDLPIGLPDDGGPGRVVRGDGAVSVTRYKVLGKNNLPEIGGISILEISLETGRTHQIRVHLSHLGYPIVGDTLYGEKITDCISRQALHAFSLSFRHPQTGSSIRILAPIPKDISILMGGIQVGPLTDGMKKE